MSYDEMAVELDITVDAVKSRLKRARKDLIEKAQPFLRMDADAPKEVS
jgi:DNA-directed RNA polymerase specialized sigma24 family protein